MLLSKQISLLFKSLTCTIYFCLLDTLIEREKTAFLWLSSTPISYIYSALHTSLSLLLKAISKLMKVLARTECSLEVSIRVVKFQYIKIK